MTEPATHLRAEGQTWAAACGRAVDEFLLGDSSEDIECKACRRTAYFRRVYLEETGEEFEEDDSE